MKYLDNPKTVAQELKAIFDDIRNSERGYQHDRINFIGQDVYEAALKAYPDILKPKEFNASNDYSGHQAKSELFVSKNKSRATFIPMYTTEVFLHDDGSLQESNWDKSMTTIMAVDGRYYHMHFRNGQGAVVEGFYELNDSRDYYHHLPYGYSETHPWPAKGVSALTDAKLDAWIGCVTEKQNDYDNIIAAKTDAVSTFIQSIKDSIDPEKCEKYEVGQQGGEIIANNIRLQYNVCYDVVHASLDIYRSPFGPHHTVTMFSQMTDTEKYTSPEVEA